MIQLRRVMSIKSELEKLNERDIWSLILFTLYQTREIPEYSGISELAYILDKKNLFKLCEYFGGCIIKIPTIEELEILIYALLLFEYVDIDHIDIEEAILKIDIDATKRSSIKEAYFKIRDVLSNYEFTSRGKI